MEQPKMCDCGRVYEEPDYPLPYNASKLLTDKCQQCRARHYIQKHTFSGWVGSPGGSEGLLLAHLLDRFWVSGYTEKDIVCIWMDGKAYQWAPEAFNYVYRNDAGPAAILQLDSIVMSDGSWFEVEAMDPMEKSHPHMLVHHGPCPSTPPTLLDSLTKVFKQYDKMGDFDYNKFQKHK